MRYSTRTHALLLLSRAYGWFPLRVITDPQACLTVVLAFSVVSVQFGAGASTLRKPPGIVRTLIVMRVRVLLLLFELNDQWKESDFVHFKVVSLTRMLLYVRGLVKPGCTVCFLLIFTSCFSCWFLTRERIPDQIPKNTWVRAAYFVKASGGSFRVRARLLNLRESTPPGIDAQPISGVEKTTLITKN